MRLRTRTAAHLTLILATLAWGCRPQTPEARAVTGGGPPTPPAAAVTGQGTLLLLADVRGVLKPCGCTVDLQKGGFDRLTPVLAAERERNPGALVVHAGPLFFPDAAVEPEKAAQRARQAEVLAELVARAGFDVAGAAAVDHAAAAGKLGELAQAAKVQLTAANLALGQESEVVVERVGDLRVGLFALAAAELPGAAGVQEPEAAARAAVAALRGRADVVVLLSELGLRATKRLVRRVPGVHFAVAGGLGEHPVFSDEAELVGSTRVMQFHREGRFVGRLTLRVEAGSTDFADASAPSEADLASLDARIAGLAASLTRWRAEREPGDREVRSAEHHLEALRGERSRLGALRGEAPPGRSSFSLHVTPLNWDLPQDPAIEEVMSAFDAELQRIVLANAGTVPEAAPGEATYVGVGECLDCHEEVQAFWDRDRHRGAWETLVEAGKTFDADCVSCHVTGYGRPGGSLLGAVDGREDVQCEACHGPGSLHSLDSDVPMPISAPAADTCEGCHNAHHSPEFSFPVWSEKLIVPGHGEPLAKTP